VTRVLAPALVALALATAAPAAAQSKASTPVKIDFRALTEDGQPVSDLKAEELTLKVNGKVRPVQALAVFHGSAADAAA